MFKRKGIRIVLSLGIVLLAATVSGAAEYAIKDLGTLGGLQSETRDINNANRVAGLAKLSTGWNHAFLWTLNGTAGPSTNPQMRDLGTRPDDVGSEAFALNERSVVVGQSYYYGGAGKSAFIWENGVMEYLNVSGGTPYPTDLNDSGFVVGYALPSNGPIFGWIVDTSTRNSYGVGTMTALPTLGGPRNYAYDINNAGQVTGSSDLATGGIQAYVWSATAGIQGLGSLGCNSWGRAINELGHIAGQAQFSIGDDDRPMVWKPGTGMVNLGLLPGAYNGTALGLNDLDQVVGRTSESAGVFPDRAFIWDSAHLMRDLNMLIPSDSGWYRLTVAFAINNNGSIVGNGYKNGNLHGFLLLPDGDHDGAGDIEDNCPGIVNPN